MDGDGHAGVATMQANIALHLIMGLLILTSYLVDLVTR
jgi:hypothetical protein